MTEKIIPGEVITADTFIELNKGKETLTMEVSNTSDRPVQVGSHSHFFEVNRSLKFDRAKAYGYHLDIPSGCSVRFEPGEIKEVNLVLMSGSKTFYGLNNLTQGKGKDKAIEKAISKGFISEGGQS